MNFKNFFVKKIMMSFFVSVTCICAAMVLIGMTFESDTHFGYEAFLSPLIFGAVASLPLLVTYSKNELSVKQIVIRDVIHLILLEVVILSVLYFGEIITSISMAISLGVSIFMIDLTVNLVLWINDKRSAKEFNDALKRLQNYYGAD
jgi:hypothetical protein